MATAKEGGRRADDDATREDAMPPWAMNATIEDAASPVMSSDQPAAAVAAAMALERTDIDRRAVTRTADPIPRGVPKHGTEPIPEPGEESAPDSRRRYMELEAFLLEEASDPLPRGRGNPSRRDGTPPPVSPLMTGSLVTGAPARRGVNPTLKGAVAGTLVACALLFWMSTRTQRQAAPGSPTVATATAQADPPPSAIPAPQAVPASPVSSATPMAAAAAASTNAPAPAPSAASRPARPTSPKGGPPPTPAKPQPGPPPSQMVVAPDPVPSVIVPPPRATSTDSELKQTVVH
jgi:hypothetical protein